MTHQLFHDPYSKENDSLYPSDEEPHALWLPGDGHSHMSADIICLYYDPFFYANLTPNYPIFHYSPHRMTPFFQNFNLKFNFFCVLRGHFKNVVNFQWKKANFTQIWQNLHRMTLYFGKFTPKKAQFFWIPHPMTPLFLRILHQMPPVRVLQ